MDNSGAPEAPLPEGLIAFLSAPADDEPWPAGDGEPDLAGLELFVEEQLLGEPESRFVQEGGVRLSRVTCYRIEPEILPPLARRRPEFGDLSFALVKFWLNFDELPASRQYAVIRVRVKLTPAVPALMLRPDLDASEAESERTSTSEFAPQVAKLLITHTRTRSTRRTERLPVATAVDHGADGFGWTFQAQDGAPLISRRQIAEVLLELPRGTTELAGLFDAEAQVRRRLLGSYKLRWARPIDSAAPFLVALGPG